MLVRNKSVITYCISLFRESVFVSITFHKSRCNKNVKYLTLLQLNAFQVLWGLVHNLKGHEAYQNDDKRIPNWNLSTIFFRLQLWLKSWSKSIACFLIITDLMIEAHQTKQNEHNWSKASNLVFNIISFLLNVFNQPLNGDVSTRTAEASSLLS